MIGFVYSLPGIKDGKPTQWSHMAGVLPEYQSRGLGFQLKLLQRERALNAGLDLGTGHVCLHTPITDL